MTQEDQEKQVGALVLRIRDAEDELSQYREKAQAVKEQLESVLGSWGRFTVAYPDGQTATLVDVDGEPVTLPATEELTDAYLNIRRLEKERSDLERRYSEVVGRNRS